MPHLPKTINSHQERAIHYLEAIQHAAVGSMPKPTKESGSSWHPNATFIIEPWFDDGATICFTWIGTYEAELMPLLATELALLQFDILPILSFEVYSSIGFWPVLEILGWQEIISFLLADYYITPWNYNNRISTSHYNQQTISLYVTTIVICDAHFENLSYDRHVISFGLKILIYCHIFHFLTWFFTYMHTCLPLCLLHRTAEYTKH